MKAKTRSWKRNGKLRLCLTSSLTNWLRVPTMLILDDVKQLEIYKRRITFPDKSRKQLQVNYRKVIILITNPQSETRVKFTGDYLGVFESQTKLALYQLPKRGSRGVPKPVIFDQAKSFDRQPVQIKITFQD
ncbi:hypothetical protein ACFL0Z_02375 [Patescibacteria group bacterium]